MLSLKKNKFRKILCLISLSCSFSLVTSPTSADQQLENTSSARPTLDRLRVCADPNNLPMSNKKGQGYENKIAELLADYFSAKLEYAWFPQRMGFIRNTLKNWSDLTGEFACDVVIGVPQQFDQASTTEPYYRSSYTAVLNTNATSANVKTQQDISNLTDDVKQNLKVAAFAPSPSVNWVRENGLFDSTEFFRIMNGDPEDYPGKMVQRVSKGEFDMLLVWGPIAGYFARDYKNLNVIPMSSSGSMIFDFPFSMAVRYGEKEWKNTIEHAIKANLPQIHTILKEYGVPIVQASSLPLPSDDD